MFCLFVFCCVARAALSFPLKAFSAAVSSSASGLASHGVLSMIPDPTTGLAQPRIALNLTNRFFVGGRRSPFGGVATRSQFGSWSYIGGDRSLEIFDFSKHGWIAAGNATTVSSVGSMIAYTTPCTPLFPCSVLFGNGLQPTTIGNATLFVDARTGVPLSLNVSRHAVVFEAFDSNPATFQRDPSIYELPGHMWSTKALPPNVTTVSWIRSFTVDGFARYLANDNIATFVGEAAWASCTTNPLLVFAQFDLQVDANFGAYAMCRHGSCSCPSLSSCQRVGRQSNGPNDNFWFSLPGAARCAPGFPIGTNNCSWSGDYSLVKAVNNTCVLHNVTDPNFPNGFHCANVALVANHLKLALQQCSDVQSSLPWAFNV